MQERKFVLLPMLDLNLDWNHPILHKNMLELIKESKDKSICKVVQDLESPLQKLSFNHLNYIAIEGNIGVGTVSYTHLDVYKRQESYDF